MQRNPLVDELTRLGTDIRALQEQVAQLARISVPGNFTPTRMLYAGSDGRVAQSTAAIVTDGTSIFVSNLIIPSAAAGTMNLSSTGAGTASAIEVGGAATGNRYAFIDLHGDDTNTDFSLRLIRNNTGVNADSALVHQGTGNLSMQLLSSGGRFNVNVGGTERIAADASTNLWQNMTLVNSWVYFGAPYTTAQYMKDACGVVHVKGMIKNGGALGTNIAVLPAGYRPTETHIFAATSNNAFGSVRIDSGGQIQQHVGVTTWLSMDGISFASF